MPAPTVDVLPRYFSIASASRYTGLAAITIRRLAAQGKFRLLKPSPNRTLVDREELDAYLQGTGSQRAAAGEAGKGQSAAGRPSGERPLAETNATF
jgi:excisionase family DNA binding protein